jgi:hypothetical protein
MQVFVLRSDLELANPPAVAIYPELPIIPRDFHGVESAVLSLPDAATRTNPDVLVTTLVGDWRILFVDQVIDGEARRRIDESFSEYMQRNALWAVQHNITRYGANPATWGTTEQQIYATCEQAWAYVAAVRQTADAMISNMPIDPTADANWPARLSPPVYIPA